MNRRSFFTRFAAFAGAAVVAPRVLADSLGQENNLVAVDVDKIPDGLMPVDIVNLHRQTNGAMSPLTGRWKTFVYEGRTFHIFIPREMDNECSNDVK